jgi:membrane-bound lytic murein transglycosylase A
MRYWLIFSLLFVLAACGEEEAIVSEDQESQVEQPQLQLVQSDFSALPAWGGDDFTDFVPAFFKSCERIGRVLSVDPDRAFGVLEEAGMMRDWQGICAELQALVDASGGAEELNRGALQAFIEARFTPHQILSGEEEYGLFTGYYEASLRGSKTRSDVYHVPLHRRPDDLVMVDLGLFREHLKGERIAGRVTEGALRPYETRAQIVSGNWPHENEDHALVWVDDPVDAFFLQIQGSGRILLEDGTTMRVGYAGQNGHPYYAIGRELILREQLTRETVSMQSIRDWLAANPHQADEIMNTNKSYVFFVELEGEGPIGGENIALTPLRSLAIDRSLLPYGLPIWVDISPPMEGHTALQRLMMGQDTGGAIRGAVRGDVFWGYGEEAEILAGHMKSQGRYWALLPKVNSE